MNDISQLRKKLFQLNEKRWKITGNIMRSGELLTASLYERLIKSLPIILHRNLWN